MEKVKIVRYETLERMINHMNDEQEFFLNMMNELEENLKKDGIELKQVCRTDLFKYAFYLGLFTNNVKNQTGLQRVETADI